MQYPSMSSRVNRLRVLLVLAGCLLLVQGLRMTPVGHAMELRLRGKKTVADRLHQYGASADGRWAPRFRAAEIPYPPARITLLAIKDERILQVYAANRTSAWRHVATFPVRGMSGTLGPKLREGDNQVPEGIYQIEALNPNSLYHLSLRVNYPNASDRRHAASDGRTNLGGDIMIHGKTSSIGCLAMGDEVAEDLFVLVARMDRAQATVLLAPTDLRHQPIPRYEAMPPWLADLYEDLKTKLDELPPPTSTTS